MHCNALTSGARQMLLHRATRESLGLRVAGNVVIVDEAHNIVEAVRDTLTIL